MAMNGNKVDSSSLMQYVIGKPVSTASVDRVEHDEWAMRQEQPNAAEFQDQEENRYPHKLANVLYREADRAKGEALLVRHDATVSAREAAEKKQAERAERRRQKKAERQRRRHGG